MTSSLRDIQELVRDYLKTDPDFTDISIFTESSLDLNKDVEQALSENIGSERKGLCIVIEMLSGKVSSPNHASVIFEPAMLHFMVIENVEINRNISGTVRYGLDVAETLMAIMCNFKTSESGWEQVFVYPAAEGLDREDVPEMGVIIHHCFMRLNCGSVDETSVVATPVITYDEGGTDLVTITCSTITSTIRYTQDGTRPTSSSTLYSAPFSPTGDTVRARAFRVGWRSSLIADFVIP